MEEFKKFNAQQKQFIQLLLKIQKEEYSQALTLFYLCDDLLKSMKEIEKWVHHVKDKADKAQLAQSDLWRTANILTDKQKEPTNG